MIKSLLHLDIRLISKHDLVTFTLRYTLISKHDLVIFTLRYTLISKHDLVTFTLRHKLKKRNSAFVSLLHFTVAIGSLENTDGQSKMNIPETTKGTQDEEKPSKYIAQYVLDTTICKQIKIT